ncbi:hypothetical protein [Herbaspirillum sp. CAH-3]|uniref:hypothetical protein n=1 Tax=Herbaspirillum sp. CAH-3 TaxID=2605746 RepID=UPI0012ACA886|nr:hypothetical protein [Herbaspirillum sp. CAH-3]MRT30775.1 hypothetical protein [Herbaspirillum sp. CAH-3]
MNDNVKPWPNVAGRMEIEQPKRIMRPCDYGLLGAINSLETQLGTIEAYNRLAEAAQQLRDKIEAGNAKPQNPMFAKSIRGD